MRFLRILLVVCALSVFSVQGQENNKLETHWQYLFQNRQSEALSKFEKKKQKTLPEILTREIIKNENGIFANDEGFIEKVGSFPDFEYYLYALWSHNFFFDTYLSTGFNGKNVRNIKTLQLEAIQNPTVKESLRYLKSAVAQHSDDWETYYQINAEIPAIKAWQFCGSFENLNGSGLDTEYGPEKYAVSQNDFNANSNGFINWYEIDERKKEAYQYYSNHSEYGGGVNYAQTFIYNPSDRKVVVRLGSSSFSKLWLNDVLIYENTNDGISDLDAYNVLVNLPKGNNRLLVKNADTNGIAYFIVRITDEEGRPINGLTYSAKPSDYPKSTLATIAPQPLDHPVEAFFKKRLEASPNDFMNRLCLINTYLRNSKYNEAKALLQPLLAAYPQSSFLRKYLIESYSKENDYASAKEVQKNIQNDDENYYLSYVYQFEDSRELFKLPLVEFEKFVNDFSASTDMDVLKESAQLLLHIRKEDKGAVKQSLKEITEKHSDQLGVVKAYIGIYSGYLNEDDKAIELLENINANYFDYAALKTLASFYNKQNRKDEALALFENRYDLVAHDNIYLSDYISYLHEYKRYEASLPYIDQMLKNFPYSFVAMELKGTALEQSGRKKEALTWYKKSLKHNSANAALRKKIDDLSNAKDYLEEFATPNIYEFMAENRNRGVKGHYGFNYLLDESLLQLYPEGGGKSRTRYVVEITSDSGIESLKEVNLGLSGNYHITKSEIVKPNKKIVPASKSGSNLVFNNLEIGDILYVDYESSYANSGRFYKDHVDYFQFDSYHPIYKNSLKVLVPKGKEFISKTLNGEVPYRTEEVDGYVCHEWETIGQEELGPEENFMPSLGDIARYVHVSTIGSWDDIAHWYSDLVRPQMLVNSDVQEAFDKIFPKGSASLTDDEKASRIYYYIMENFSYSYVSFRQSGYVPQRPAKTIKSKLGDCKDFSTLYVTLAQMAGLKAHLVLVLTSDYGEKTMTLPSQDFNHCIAKVFIEGKPQYLELTDNNMPYRAIPTSLEHATALDIPNKWVKDVKSGIYKLDDIAHIATELESKMEYTIGEGKHRLQIESILKGSINSHYAAIFKEKNYEVIRKSLADDFKGRISEDFTFDSIHDIHYELRSPVLKYVSDLTVNEKFDEIGSMKVFRIPAVNNAYNTSIIQDDERAFPIDYLLYENADTYKSSYVIKLEEGQRFVEIPESADYSFKKHRFKIDYDLVKDNELHISIEANTSKERIAASEYKGFKAYVKAALDAKQQLIGFKKDKKSIKVSFSEKK
ncbi:Tetratricopeptide repeat-containing protein [Zobellia uliginosa]|uniref:Tetratricopeptide repeat-containing protein n=1 Tax=Zobellia uliginosa TaxID=143224 RepID=A0ABY1KL02_9FLAO|nr:transglutaminase domain-containing protein [Zobellia uliginosa]SIS38938.1 Tetratricopeptide repeat-containing protein [Zobellia uliginosa]